MEHLVLDSGYRHPGDTAHFWYIIFTLLSAAMAGKTGLKAKWRHLADLPHSGARHAQHGTPLPYAPRNFQLRREGARGCTFGGNTLTPAMALRSAAKSA